MFFSDIAWDSLHQRPQHLATLLARTRRVLWIEPATLGHRVLFSPVEQVAGVFRMTIPAFPLNARNRWIRRIAVFISRAAFLRQMVAALQGLLLRRGLRRVHDPGGDVVCIVENFLFMRLARSLHPRRVVFDYIDDVFGFNAFPDYVPKRMAFRRPARRRGDRHVRDAPQTDHGRSREGCDAHSQRRGL